MNLMWLKSHELLLISSRCCANECCSKESHVAHQPLLILSCHGVAPPKKESQVTQQQQKYGIAEKIWHCSKKWSYGSCQDVVVVAPKECHDVVAEKLFIAPMPCRDCSTAPMSCHNYG